MRVKSLYSSQTDRCPCGRFSPGTVPFRLLVLVGERDHEVEKGRPSSASPA